MADDVPAAFPSGFYCEHTPSKVRVYALVRLDGGPQTLTAVLTVADRELAGRVARVLNSAIGSVPGPVLQAEVDEVSQLLPVAPRASFAQSLEYLRTSTWPTPAHYSTWPDVDEEDGEHEESQTPRRLIDEFARTLGEARLAEHSGPVMRLGRLLELHVHDAARVLSAAHSLGWVPDQDDESDEQDHLLDAVMWLAEEEVDIPGVDVVTEQGVGHILDPAREEVADWSRSQITLAFDAGWRLRDADPDQADPRVDYAALFPLPACDHTGEEEHWCDECEGFVVSPRTAAVLATALAMLADECRDDIEQHGDEPAGPDGSWLWFDQLPRITWQQNAAWRERFAQAARHLQEDLDSGRSPRPRSRAEEMALHLALGSAEGVIGMMDDSAEYAKAVVGGLPRHPDDYNWDRCVDLLMCDSDILFLFDQSADGIEDPEVEINRHFDIGDMRPASWFDLLPGMSDRGAKNN